MYMEARNTGSGVSGRYQAKRKLTKLTVAASVSVLALLGATGPASAATPGVTKSTIRIGGVMDLEGDSRGLGQGMQLGIQAAFKGKKIKGRALEFVALNDFYNPANTIESTQKLIDKGIFLMLGNVGTPTAKVSLPLLAKHQVPAMGFFTGAGLLRPGVGDVINFRASYVQETATVINNALANGIQPDEVCAFVQNDAYGMAGIAGMKAALANHPGTDEITAKLNGIMAMDGAEPARNGVGPVGVYRRNTLYVRDGYESLKAWEQINDVRCRLVVGVGTYRALANFSGYAKQKGEQWLLSAVSFTGADNFRAALADYDISNGIIMTQVVPPLGSDLPIVAEARAALGDDFGYVSLEGYIVGKLFIAALKDVKKDLTRESFLNAIRGRRFDLGGLAIDFSDDNQGSDYVSMTYLSDGRFDPVTIAELQSVLQ
jgi:ABC-type branched-subunit amino acid transport system substrate-binding protein